jgi:hypothetical protein
MCYLQVNGCDGARTEIIATIDYYTKLLISGNLTESHKARIYLYSVCLVLICVVQVFYNAIQLLVYTIIGNFVVGCCVTPNRGCSLQLRSVQYACVLCIWTMSWVCAVGILF